MSTNIRTASGHHSVTAERPRIHRMHPIARERIAIRPGANERLELRIHLDLGEEPGVVDEIAGDG